MAGKSIGIGWAGQGMAGNSIGIGWTGHGRAGLGKAGQDMGLGGIG